MPLPEVPTFRQLGFDLISGVHREVDVSNIRVVVNPALLSFLDAAYLRMYTDMSFLGKLLQLGVRPLFFPRDKISAYFEQQRQIYADMLDLTHPMFVLPHRCNSFVTNDVLWAALTITPALVTEQVNNVITC